MATEGDGGGMAAEVRVLVAARVLEPVSAGGAEDWVLARAMERNLAVWVRRALAAACEGVPGARIENVRLSSGRSATPPPSLLRRFLGLEPERACRTEAYVDLAFEAVGTEACLGRLVREARARLGDDGRVDGFRTSTLDLSRPVRRHGRSRSWGALRTDVAAMDRAVAAGDVEEAFDAADRVASVAAKDMDVARLLRRDPSRSPIRGWRGQDHDDGLDVVSDRDVGVVLGIRFEEARRHRDLDDLAASSAWLSATVRHREANHAEPFHAKAFAKATSGRTPVPLAFRQGAAFEFAAAGDDLGDAAVANG